jgi:hypothetical protein
MKLLPTNILVVMRMLFLNIRWDTGTRWRWGRSVSDAETMCLSDGAMEGSDLLEAPDIMLGIMLRRG